MAVDNNEALIFTSKIIAGYFYTFNYTAKQKVGTDQAPVIYCIYAPEMDDYFIGLNFHYFSQHIVARILVNMQKMKHIMDNDIPHIFNGHDLYKCFTDVGYGVKMYKKERVRHCYRIKNFNLAEILGISSDFFMSNDQQKEMERELSTTSNKGY